MEYINRSRANPPAEGARLAGTTDPDVLGAYSYWGVNLSLMQAEFNTNPPVPPLAMSAQLLASARWHSGDMFTNQYQSHEQTNNGVVMEPWDRMRTNGYVPWYSGENVFCYAKSVFHGHAGFDVDWGTGPGGMQADLGHRANIPNGNYREIGVGVVDGVNGGVGPQLVTQDFGSQSPGAPLLSGVAYYDFNGNGFYDVGEGIGGVTVAAPGASYYAFTADSGGYTVPLSSNGNYTVTFSGSGLNTQRVVTVSGLKNVKLDFVPAYSPPLIAGPNPAYVNTSNFYTFSAVGGATGYQWEQALLTAYTAVEGAENGLANVTVVSTPGYAVVASDLKASGSYSFHLGHTNPPADQRLTLNPVLRLGANSQLTFAKLLGYAFSNEVARAQITTNSGATWQDVWSQGGNDGSVRVDTAFVRITNSLAAYAGQVAQIRFVFSYSSGYYYLPYSWSGLYLDDIGVSNAEQLLNQATNSAAGASFSFNPASATNYLLMVRAQINSRTLSWGPALRLGAVLPPPSLQLASQPAFAGGQIQLDFTVANYRTNMTFQLWKAPSLGSGFTQDTSAVLSTLIANSKYRFTTATGAVSRTFYRVKGSY